MSSETAIVAADLGKVYTTYRKPFHRLVELFLPASGREPLGRSFHALSHVGFEIKKGETFGILGRNGSGKSTLLQVISGILEPTTGEVLVKGRIAALLELGAGFNPEFTGRENVRLYGGLLGMDSATLERRLPGILEFADIGEFIDEPVKHYSSGMYVRLAFSVAIHVEPEILIVDEALSVGDEAFQRKCFSRIEEIKRAGATILFVSHSVASVLQLCDRAMVLHEGRRIYLGDPNSAVAIYQRIIYAPKDKVEGILEHARDMDVRGVGMSAQPAEAAEAIEVETPAGDPELAKITLERFDEGLVSKSRFEFEQNGARIIDPRIVDADGAPVNVLEHGREYRYMFDVEFSRDAVFVHFGMLIKSVSGVEISGASSHFFDDAMQDVPAGARTRVVFHWVCDLLPGTYFLNAGCNGVVDRDIGETFLHRIVDAYAFRVEVAGRPRRTAGFFNVLVAPFVELTVE
ncbi:MAG: ABC transporter ATP-binding protein [Pseudoxanthomonas sp.]|nr:MAG: ABC transporter ATP-binding protein [Pseudoxanthomonas sp.]